MPSPFPGMDPWLESPAVFPDFHSAFLNAFRVALNAVLPPPFYAGLSTRVWMEESDRRVEPDVDVLLPANQPASAGAGLVVAADARTDLLEIVGPPLPSEEREERYIEIYASPGGDRLVTSVELLSPSNKTPGSGGRDLYRAKQQEMVHGRINLVEIDLLRRGTHATLVPVDLLRQRGGRFDYHVCLHRADKDQSYFVAPIPLPHRLPTIPVPLTPGVPAVSIDLQVVLDRCYDEALYARRVRYDRSCDPPLSDEQRVWAEDVLRAKGLVA
ncbi:DUF4058 family protein [Fimbriiglobus ruber]|uniref:DUF4058 family protein n=1 Tax=Fimbriiglobus ruber TaxID=1908690 RepID=A0A225DDH2_9BACT|nr:DUF4058 family protein [Fimbriiglobus ruber]OWK36568.1 hypothetical protein FRUB_09131 [Fimbriiglobus ruber]